MHQLRVAAVAKLVGEHQSGKANQRTVILATLFHDMGNILKFDLSPASPLAALFEEKGASYWQEVQREFADTYGTDEHAATVAIAKEIKLPVDVLYCIENMGFSQTRAILEKGSIELQIAEYGDMRVGPYGIIPARDRLDDLRRRYEPRWKQSQFLEMGQRFDDNYQAVLELEQKLFRDSHINPEDINDVSAAAVIEALWDYEIA